MRGLEALPELIRRSGTSTVFGMLGGTNAPWVAQGAHNNAFRFIKTRHEDTAVNAAAGFSRSSKSIGIATVSRGPGFANSINALISATGSHVPLLLIVPESPSTRDITDQNVNQHGITELIGAGFNHVRHVDDLEPTFWSAYASALTNGNPQVLSIADGIIDSEVGLTNQSAPAAPTKHPAPAVENIAASIHVLKNARRPLILAGQGAVLADCRVELEELAYLVGATLACTLRASSFFSGNPHDLGLCGGWSPKIVRKELEACDAVFAVGASLNEKTTAEGRLFTKADVIQCDVKADVPLRASRPNLRLIGDGRTVTQALIDEWRRQKNPARDVGRTASNLNGVKQALLDVDLGHDPRRGLDPRTVCTSIARALPDDRIVVTDLGRYLGILPTLVPADDAHSWLLGRGSGSIGLGLGTAVGASAAHPDRTVVLFCGDGGFMISSHDLDVARLNGLSFSIVIFNDEQLGLDIPYVTRYGLPKNVLQQTLPDIAALAHAVGGHGITVRTHEDLDSLTFSRSGLHIVDARIDPEVNVRNLFL